MRNYKKECEWQKNKYDQIRVNVNKEMGKKFREKLKLENRTIANWLVERIKKYLEK